MKTSNWIMLGGCALFLLQIALGEVGLLPVMLMFVSALLEKIESLEERVARLDSGQEELP